MRACYTERYGDVAAVNDGSLSIEEGEVFGLVGPDGADKTTLIAMIEGLRSPHSGSIRVLGLDQSREAREVQERTGVPAPDHLHTARYQGQRGNQAICQSVPAAARRLG